MKHFFTPNSRLKSFRIIITGVKTMKMMKMLIALLTVTVLLTGSAFAAGKKIVVATDATWPPMEMLNATIGSRLVCVPLWVFPWFASTACA